MLLPGRAGSGDRIAEFAALFVTVLRWIAGVVAALLALGAIFGLAISVAFDNEIWAERTRRLRAWLGVVALAWFNGEVWGRVVYTLLHWA